MRLKLDLDGIILELCITDYRKTTTEDWDVVWTQMAFSLTSPPWLDFHNTGELLLSCEIDMLETALDELLKNKLDETKTLECMEPDFKFVLHPQKDLTKDSRYIHVCPGYEIEDISVDWQVSFWNQGLTSNFISVNILRQNIEDFLVYLKLVKGLLSESDSEVQGRIQKQIFIPLCRE